MFEEQSKALQNSMIELATRGYLVRPNVGQCQNCAGSVVREAVFRAISHEDPNAIRGVAFWSAQDEKDRVEYGSFYLCYGNMPLDEHHIIVIGDPDVDIGNVICEVLNEHGLQTRWNGEKSQRIQVFEPGGVDCSRKPQMQCDGSGNGFPELN